MELFFYFLFLFWLSIHFHQNNVTKINICLMSKPLFYIIYFYIINLDYEPPPEPAPPEIPPRAQSLLASLTKKLSSHTLKINETGTGDMKHEEFIPQNQQGKRTKNQISLIYLKTNTSISDRKHHLKINFRPHLNACQVDFNIPFWYWVRRECDKVINFIITMAADHQINCLTFECVWKSFIILKQKKITHSYWKNLLEIEFNSKMTISYIIVALNFIQKRKKTIYDFHSFWFTNRNIYTFTQVQTSISEWMKKKREETVINHSNYSNV